MLELDLQKAPIRVRSLFPLRVDVDADKPGQVLETPRRYLSGYRMSVNGLPSTPLRTPSGQLAAAYIGPWPLRVAFWVTLGSWIAVTVALLRPSPGRETLDTAL